MVNILNAKEYIQNFLKIRTKDAQLIPFVLNKPQLRLYEAVKAQWNAGKPARIIILKARQMGFSTITDGLIFWSTATAKNRDAMIVAHKDDATQNLFAMIRRYYQNLPDPVKPLLKASNAQELLFDVPTRGAPEGAEGLGSRIRCATAGGQGVGRSYTLQAAHLSEFAFWPGDKMDTLAGITQAVPDSPGTLIVIESTANGYDEFKKLWDKAVEDQRNGVDGFTPVFFPWYEMDEYRRPAPENFEPTEEEEKLAVLFGLDNEQLSWRRWCIAANCGGDIRLFHQEYPATPDEAFLSTGSCVFDERAIAARRKEVEHIPCVRGEFEYDYDDTKAHNKITNIRFVEGGRGIVRMYKEPDDGAPYVIGGDTAGTGSDSFVGQVLDNRTGAQVAVLQHTQDEILYTRQMYCLGKYYNDALIGIETNYSTYPQRELERLGYTRFYVREHIDSFTGKTAHSFGFNTNVSTRPLIIDNLKAVAAQELELIGDYETLGEMLVFVYDENYRPEAQEGEHDDLVMALAIAHFIRGQQFTMSKNDRDKMKSMEWTSDMWEDFKHADPKARAQLLAKWGKPKSGRRAV